MKKEDVELLDNLDDLDLSLEKTDKEKEKQENNEIDDIISMIEKQQKEIKAKKKTVKEDEKHEVKKTVNHKEAENHVKKKEPNHDKVENKKSIIVDDDKKKHEEIDKAIDEVINSSDKKSSKKKSSNVEDIIKSEINNKDVKVDKENTNTKNVDKKENNNKNKRVNSKSKKLKKKKINKIIGIVMSSIILLLLIAFIGYIVHINIIPTKYLLIGLPVFIILNLISMVLYFGNKWGKTIATIMFVIHLAISGVGVYYLDGLNDTLNSMTEFTEMEIYNIVVRKDSNYTSVDLLGGKILGVLGNESKNYAKAIKNTLKKVSVTTKKYENVNIMVNDLLEGNIDAILISSNNKSLLQENLIDFRKDTNSIEDISISVIKKVEAEYKHKYGPFNILISGIDTSGPIGSTSRSDVNMILTVNQHTHDVLITNVVRDMYVQLHGTTGTKDKLTHAGMYGVDMTRLTLEDFLETEIPYYVRVNFSSVVEIIDAIGGVDIYNDKAFSTGTYYFKKGNIHLNGKAALAYSRERKHLQGGDWTRGLHQQLVIDGIIRKISSSREILSNYGPLMNTLGKYIQTNIPDETMRKYIKDQLDSMPSWNISRTSVDVIDGGLYPTYSMPGMKLYASIHSEDSRLYHSKAINDLLNIE